MIHELLGEPVQPPSGSNNGPPRVRLKLSQAFLWQIPKMLLNGSLYLFTVGLCVLTYWDFTKSFDVSVETVQVSVYLSMLLLNLYPCLMPEEGGWNLLFHHLCSGSDRSLGNWFHGSISLDWEHA